MSNSFMEPYWQAAEDWHTAGEPFRIVDDLPAGALTPGLTVAEQRQAILQTPEHPLDILRRCVSREPRGHDGMYGGFILPPNDAGAHFGVLFWHKDGFSTACGHGTIALGHWGVSRGLVKGVDDGVVDVVIDVPSGRVTARVECKQGLAVHADFINVPSYQIADHIPLKLDLGDETVDMETSLSFAGAVLASVDADALQLDISPANASRFIELQRQIKAQFRDYSYLEKYDLTGVCFFQHLKDDTSCITQKNVVVVADGLIDRSPCGTGTAARVATLLAQGGMSEEKTLRHLSILDTAFEGTIVSLEPSPTEFPACIPCVRGNAYLVGKHSFYMNRKDPLYSGFGLK